MTGVQTCALPISPIAPASVDADSDPDSLPVIPALFDEPFALEDSDSDDVESDDDSHTDEQNGSAPTASENGKPDDHRRSRRRSFGRRQEANIQLNDSHAAFGSDGEIETFGGPFLSVSDAETPSYNQEIAGLDWFIWADDDEDAEPAKPTTSRIAQPVIADKIGRASCRERV